MPLMMLASLTPGPAFVHALSTTHRCTYIISHRCRFRRFASQQPVHHRAGVCVCHQKAAGADINKATTRSGSTPLYAAAYGGHESVVELLLTAGAEVDKATTYDGSTALGIASCFGHSKVCSLLLEAGANVNHQFGGNVGPSLRVAVKRGHREAALVLMQHGASSGNGILTQAMLMGDLTQWMAEALKEKERVMKENNSRQMEQMVLGIPEWCAQAASSMAAPGHNGGINSAPSPPLLGCVGRKHKAS